MTGWAIFVGVVLLVLLMRQEKPDGPKQSIESWLYHNSDTFKDSWNDRYKRPPS